MVIERAEFGGKRAGKWKCSLAYQEVCVADLPSCVLDLVGFLQQEFAVTIEDDDLVPENFKSIECMAHFVERVVAPQSGPIQ
jgi:hypothetical protein